MKKTILIAAASALAAASVTAFAEQYVDYTPQKGAWQFTEVKVEPAHIDDYLVGLKRGWVPGEKIAQKHGLIDQYMIMVKLNSSDGGGNVVLAQHFTSLAGLDPDKARDQTMEKESYAAMSKDAQEKQVEGYNKYRTFVGDSFYVPVDMGK